MSTASQFWVYLPGYVIAAPLTYLAVQQRRRAIRAEKAAVAARTAEQRKREQEAEVGQMVASQVAAALKSLTGTDNPAEITDPGPGNPSIRETLSQALEETAALTSEVALLHRAFELHLAAPHGGDVPEWLMRAVASQQKEVLRRAIGRL